MRKIEIFGPLVALFAFGLLTVPAVAGAGAATEATAPEGPPSAALARICRELSIKAHPTVPAGSAKGHAQLQREYFQECIARGGKMGDDASKPDGAADASSSSSGTPSAK
jgi:hypothetical protein